MQSIDLSITIVNYNTLELTRECLRSILENTIGLSVEINLVDNNSFDGSADMVENDFPSVRLIRNDENKGVAAATNQGLAVSSGRYVMTLNSDTRILPGALEKLVTFLDNHPEAGGATARLVLPDGGEHPQIFGLIPTPKTELLWALSPLWGRFGDAGVKSRFGPSVNLEETQEVFCVLWGTAFVVRQEVVKQVGPQDTRFFVYGEDIDWSMRISKAGWKLYYVSDALVIHHGGQSTSQASGKMFAQLHKSKCRMIEKHYRFGAGLILRGTIVIVSGIRLAKWAVLRLFRRQETSACMDRLWQVIRAVVTF